MNEKPTLPAMMASCDACGDLVFADVCWWNYSTGDWTCKTCSQGDELGPTLEAYLCDGVKI